MRGSENQPFDMEAANPHSDPRCDRSIALLGRGVPWPCKHEQFVGILYHWGVEVYRTGAEGSLTATLNKITDWEAENSGD